MRRRHGWIPESTGEVVEAVSICAEKRERGLAAQGGLGGGAPGEAVQRGTGDRFRIKHLPL